MERDRRERDEEPDRVPARPPALADGPAERLLALQRSAGNAAVARMLSASGRRMLARTTVRFNASDLEKVMHIMPWKHGWDELIDLQLDMRPAGKLRPEDPKLLSEDETAALEEDYAKVVEWLTRALQSPNLIKLPGAMVGGGQIWQFKYVVPKEETRRKARAFTIFITGLRPYAPGTTDLQDRYVLGDAWVETDRRDFLKAVRLNPGLDFSTWRADREGAAT